MLKYALPHKYKCITISNTFNFLTLKNRPIRWRTLYYHTYQNGAARGTRVFTTSKFRTTASDYNTAVSVWRLSDIHVKFAWQSHKSTSEHYTECVVTIMRFWRDLLASGHTVILTRHGAFANYLLCGVNDATMAFCDFSIWRQAQGLRINCNLNYTRKKCRPTAFHGPIFREPTNDQQHYAQISYNKFPWKRTVRGESTDRISFTPESKVSVAFIAIIFMRHIFCKI